MFEQDQDIKKEKTELSRKIKEGKKLFKEEIMNGISIDKNDIEELMTPIIKPYKHGKNFLVKTLRLDKAN